MPSFGLPAPAVGAKPDVDRADGLLIRRALVVGAAVLLVAGCADHTDFSGTYIGDADGSYSPERGAVVDFRIPQDAITVTMTSTRRAPSPPHAACAVMLAGCLAAAQG